MEPSQARELLDVEFGASDEDIQNAFRERVVEEHPDQSDKSNSTERFKQLQEARRTLLNADKNRSTSRSRKSSRGTDSQSPNDSTSSQSTSTDTSSTSATTSSTSDNFSQPSKRRHSDESTEDSNASARRTRSDKTQESSGSDEQTQEAAQESTTEHERAQSNGTQQNTTSDEGVSTQAQATSDGFDRFTLDDLRSMDPFAFEYLVADLWEAKGYETEVSQASGDKGIDVIAQSPETNETIVIQAKRYAAGNTVGSPEVQQYGSLRMQDPYPDRVIIVTTSSFSGQAFEVAADIGVELVDGETLLTQLNSYLAGTVKGPSSGGRDIFHRGIHEPAGKATFHDGIIFGCSMLNILAAGAVAYLYGGFGAPRYLSGIVSEGVAFVWLLSMCAICGLLYWDDAYRSYRLEGRYLLFYAAGLFTIGLIVDATIGPVGGLLSVAAVFSVSAVGLVSVGQSYLADGG